MSGAGRIDTPPLRHGIRGPIDDRARVEFVGNRHRGRAHLLVRQLPQPARQARVCLSPVIRVEHRGGLNDERSPPLGQLARRQSGHGVWHLVDERLGHPQMATATRR